MSSGTLRTLLWAGILGAVVVSPGVARADGPPPTEPAAPARLDEQLDDTVETLPPVVVREPQASPPRPVSRPPQPLATPPVRAAAYERARSLTGEVVLPRTPLAIDGGPEIPLDRGGSTDVLTPQRIYEATITRFDQVATRLPGVSARLYSGDDHLRPSISVRGMPDNGFTEYTAVLVNGINYSTLFYGWTALSIFPLTPERIWSAEVIRGAHAIRYGPNTSVGS